MIVGLDGAPGGALAGAQVEALDAGGGTAPLAQQQGVRAGPGGREGATVQPGDGPRLPLTHGVEAIGAPLQDDDLRPVGREAVAPQPHAHRRDGPRRAALEAAGVHARRAVAGAGGEQQRLAVGQEAGPLVAGEPVVTQGARPAPRGGQQIDAVGLRQGDGQRVARVGGKVHGPAGAQADGR